MGSESATLAMAGAPGAAMEARGPLPRNALISGLQQNNQIIVQSHWSDLLSVDTLVPTILVSHHKPQ